MTKARELPRDAYYDIFDKSHDLFEAISAAMDQVQRKDPDVQTDEWSDLHALLKLAGALSDLVHGFALEAGHAKPADALTDQTAPYWPAEVKLRDRWTEYYCTGCGAAYSALPFTTSPHRCADDDFPVLPVPVTAPAGECPCVHGGACYDPA